MAAKALTETTDSIGRHPRLPECRPARDGVSQHWSEIPSLNGTTTFANFPPQADIQPSSHRFGVPHNRVPRRTWRWIAFKSRDVRLPDPGALAVPNRSVDSSSQLNLTGDPPRNLISHREIVGAFLPNPWFILMLLVPGWFDPCRIISRTFYRNNRDVFFRVALPRYTVCKLRNDIARF